MILFVSTASEGAAQRDLPAADAKAVPHSVARRSVLQRPFAPHNKPQRAVRLRAGDDGVWSKVPEAAVFYHTAIFDAAHNRMVTFGGYDQNLAYRNETWTISLAGSPVRRLLSTAGTAPAREGHVATYDAPRNRMIIFGGYADLGYVNDVWVLSLSGTPTWQDMTPAGSSPSARSGATGIYDPVRDRM
ncbi:MAG TPA: kelch repeat-containing protein, partial [Candidatus Krumholzibacteria bacterium]|nr:kelch repeat-containing protein [Candidatus Krumholzibacteria bacterium]